MPLPVGTSIQIAWPSMAPGKAVAVAARCPAVAWNVTPGVVSANGAPELPSPPNSDTPLLSVWLASANNWSRKLAIWLATVVRSRAE